MEGESRKKERKRREVDERGIVTYHYHRKAFVRFTIIDHGRDGKKSKERRETGRRDGTIERERERERIVTLRKINPPSLLASLSLLRHRRRVTSITGSHVLQQQYSCAYKCTYK